MANIAFIPLRGGSKSIPLKNIKDLAGKPLFYWTAEACQDAKCIDKIIIATDSIEIKNVALNCGLSKIEVYDRDEENAQDTSSTESVMLEYLKKSKLKDDDNFFLVQATSPLLNSNHIEEMFAEFKKSKKDSALSCVVNKHFYWTKDGKAINYDYKNRPRRQDFDGYLMENGACYINSVENVINNKNRISGEIYMYQMPEYMGFEIDEPDDWIILEKLMKKYIVKKKF